MRIRTRHLTIDVTSPPAREDGFARDQRRWAFEAMLAEFKALREEIVSVKTQLERTYAYLFALIGAILASQFLDTAAPAFLEEHVWIVATAALIAMWFPINHQLMSTDMVLAGTYIRDVLAPKLNYLAYTSVSKDRLVTDREIDARLGWTTMTEGELKQELYRDVARRPMSWEQFMAYMRLGDSRRGWIFLPLYVTRGLILYVPALALLVIYVVLQSKRRIDFASVTHKLHGTHPPIPHRLGIEVPSLAIAAIVVALLVWSFMGQVRTTRMLAKGTRGDQPHEEIPGSGVPIV